MSEKEQLEKAAIEYFLRADPRKLKIQIHGDMPDFTLIDQKSNQTIGAEIAHLWHDKAEAKILLGRSENIGHGVMNAGDLIKVLNELLKDKSQKAEGYKFHNKIILIIRIASPIFDKSTFDMYESLIVCPENKYNEIWLVLCDHDKVEKWTELKQIK